MGEITATVMDKSLIVGAGLLGMAVLGAIFHFIRLGLFSAGMEKGQAGVLSGVIMGAAVVLIYKAFF